MKNFKKTIKRIWGNLKWLFNHPVTWETALPSDHGYTCKYCPNTTGLTVYNYSARTYTDNGHLLTTQPETTAICHQCRVKVFDLALLTDNTQSDSQD